MSRWAADPEAAADELIGRCLDDIDLRGRVLLAIRAGGLPAELGRRGVAFALWRRRVAAGGGGEARPWPPTGPFATALVRLPRAKDEQEMVVHACMGALAEGGRLVVWGGNDEGIRPAARLLQRLCGEVETLAVRGHGRVLAARRPSDLAHLRTTLAAWRTVTRLEIAGAARDWVSYPGLFAAGRIDEGTALLAGVLPPLHAGARVLDYGCGAGAIGAAAAAAEPGIALDLMDDDAVALEAAGENVPASRRVLGSRIGDAGAGKAYAAILSNPPLHTGFAEDHALLEQLIADAPAHLAPGGCLQLVVQRRLPLERMLAAHFASVSVVAETSRYRVWRALGSRN